MAVIDDAVGAIGDLREAFDIDGAGVHLFVYALPSKIRPNRENCWRRLSLSGELASAFLQGLDDSFSSIEAVVAEGDISEFDYDSMVDRHVGVYPLDGSDLATWLSEVPDVDWPHLFDITDKEFFSKIRYFVSVVSLADGRKFISYRGRRGLEIVLSKPGKLAAFFNREENELVEVTGPVLTMDQKIDFFSWDEMIFISNFAAFETITNLREVTKKKANECISEISARFGLPNEQQLRDAVGKKTALAKKLAAAAKHGLIDDIDGAAVIERIRKRALSISCIKSDAGYRFDFDTNDNAQIKQFIDLVSDAYLHSPTSNREWHALVKRPA